jgi:hypothetical protein
MSGSPGGDRRIVGETRIHHRLSMSTSPPCDDCIAAAVESARSTMSGSSNGAGWIDGAR